MPADREGLAQVQASVAELYSRRNRLLCRLDDPSLARIESLLSRLDSDGILQLLDYGEGLAAWVEFASASGPDV